MVRLASPSGAARVAFLALASALGTVAGCRCPSNYPYCHSSDGWCATAEYSGGSSPASGCGGRFGSTCDDSYYCESDGLCTIEPGCRCRTGTTKRRYDEKTIGGSCYACDTCGTHSIGTDSSNRCVCDAGYSSATGHSACVASSSRRRSPPPPAPTSSRRRSGGYSPPPPTPSAPHRPPAPRVEPPRPSIPDSTLYGFAFGLLSALAALCKCLCKLCNDDETSPLVTGIFVIFLFCAVGSLALGGSILIWIGITIGLLA